MRNILLPCILLLLASRMQAQLNAVVELDSKSALSIYVETNMMNFCLVQRGDKLMQAPVSISANIQNNKLFIAQNTLDIDVKGFKSENLIGQNEFYKLMKVEQYPKMSIEFVCFEACSESQTKGQAVLNITITNVTKRYEFPVLIGKYKDKLNITGKKRISITDFGLSAPTDLLLGLAKVNEQIVIGVNLICRVRKEGNDLAGR